VPVLSDPRAAVKPSAFTQHPRPAYYQGRPEAMGISVRTPRYRYTEWRDFATGRVLARELYDHDVDPHETQNRIDAPPHAAALGEAVRLLERTFPRRGYR
jgi:iduronate 2-sulfatase